MKQQRARGIKGRIPLTQDRSAAAKGVGGSGQCHVRVDIDRCLPIRRGRGGRSPVVLRGSRTLPAAGVRGGRAVATAGAPRRCRIGWDVVGASWHRPDLGSRLSQAPREGCLSAPMDGGRWIEQARYNRSVQQTVGSPRAHLHAGVESVGALEEVTVGLAARS